MLCEVESRAPHQGQRRIRFEISVGFISVIALFVITLVLILTGSGGPIADSARDFFRFYYTPYRTEILSPPKPKAWWFF